MNILFLCASNIFRSQMAEAWCKKLSKNFAESAALISNQEKMHPLVIRASKEFELDLSNQYSKILTEDLIRNADIIVLMSKDLKSSFSHYESLLKPAAKIEYWDIADVVAGERDMHLYPKFVKTCAIIRDKVKSLVLKYG